VVHSMVYTLSALSSVNTSTLPSTSPCQTCQIAQVSGIMASPSHYLPLPDMSNSSRSKQEPGFNKFNTQWHFFTYHFLVALKRYLMQRYLMQRYL